MQDAYFQEKGDVGNWVAIGYSAPGEKKNTANSYASNVFGFSGNASCGASTACTWVAVPKTKLNDCTTSMKWQLDAKSEGTANDGVYEKFSLKDNGSNSECLALTASWASLQGTH